MTEQEQLQIERLRLQIGKEREQAQNRKAKKRAGTIALVISGAIALVSAIIPLLILIIIAGRY